MVSALLVYVGHKVGWSLYNLLPIDGESDFSAYHGAAKAVLSGRSPFSQATYIYPPTLALILTPLGVLPEGSARLLWFVSNQLVLAASAWLVWRALGRDLPALMAVVVVWALAGTGPENLVLGQINPILLLLFSAFWLSCRQLPFSRRGRVGIWLLAVAAALKIWPAILLLTEAVGRRWRALAKGAALSALILAVAWGAVWALGSPRFPPSRGYFLGTPAVLNSSLPAVALRLADLSEVSRFGADLPESWLRGNLPGRASLTATDRALSMGVAVVVFIAGMAFLAGGHRGAKASGEDPDPLVVSAALIALALVAAPVSWYHYQILQTPGLALLASRRLRERAWRALGLVAVAGVGVTWLPSLGPALYAARYGWTMESPLTLFLVTGLGPLFGVLLFGLLIREARRDTPPAEVEDRP